MQGDCGGGDTAMSTIPTNRDINLALAEYNLLAVKASEIKIQQDRIRMQIIDYMGAATDLVYDNTVLATYKPGHKLDTERMKIEFPEIVDMFKIEGKRTLRIL